MLTHAALRKRFRRRLWTELLAMTALVMYLLVTTQQPVGDGVAFLAPGVLLTIAVVRSTWQAMQDGLALMGGRRLPDDASELN